MSLVLEAGADAFGMIFAPSPRAIVWSDAEEIARHAPADATAVAVFTNPSRDEVARVRELFPAALVQLSGDESPEFVRSVGGRVIKAVHVGEQSSAEIEDACERFAPALPLLDTKISGVYGGTGVAFEWSRVARVARWRPLVIAGGLTPQNVAACVRAARPFGVDVRGGVETEGRIDAEKVRRFIRAVRESDAA